MFGVAILAIAIGAMPLGWLVSGGVHETWLPGRGSGYPAMPRVRVVLVDQTSLVRFVTAATVVSRSAPRAMTATLVVAWLGGCGDYRTNLTFTRQGEGFVLRQRTDTAGCGFLIGYERAVALHLWTPIDPSTVELVGQR